MSYSSGQPELHFQHFRRVLFTEWGNKSKQAILYKASGIRIDVPRLWMQTIRDYDFHGTQNIFMLRSKYAQEWAMFSEKVRRMALSRGANLNYDDKFFLAIADVARESYFPLNFENEMRHIIKPSEGLCYRLMQATANMPLCAHMPPFPSIYIVFPPECGFFGYCEETGDPIFDLEGIYLNFKKTDRIETELENILKTENPYGLSKLALEARTTLYDPNKDSYFFEIGGCLRRKVLDADMNEMDRYAVSSTTVGVRDEDARTPEDIMDLSKRWMRKAPEKTKSIYQKNTFMNECVFRTAFNLLIHMSSPLDCKPHIVKSQLFIDAEKRKNDPKKLERILGQILEDTDVTQVMIVGQDIVVDKEEKEHTASEISVGGRRMPTHWRRGHWRGVWAGVDSDRKLVPHFIPRVLVNKDRGIAPITTCHAVVGDRP